MKKNTPLVFWFESNFGATEDFVLNGEAVGPKILEWKQEKSDMAASEEDKGSIMSILATDLPLTSRQSTNGF
ncbi:MAG: P1 family peptidase [Coprococcus sp.]